MFTVIKMFGKWADENQPSKALENKTVLTVPLNQTKVGV